MSRTYKATGINLKATVFGESDRLVTILTKEFGLLKAIAPGSRKHNSSLGGRSGMFVVNELLIAKGKTLDKITQAQTIKSYPGLAKNLLKLSASQYLAEIVLCEALSDIPQEELYELFNEHLTRLENSPNDGSVVILALLVQAVFQFLALAGLTPQVETCCLTQKPLEVNLIDPHWQVGFSISAGGTVNMQAWEKAKKETMKMQQTGEDEPQFTDTNTGATVFHHQQELPVLTKRINASEFLLLQQLPQTDTLALDIANNGNWISIEKILRQYVQYHFGRSIRSATLIDSYFAAHYDATI
jgi:DNA repair protein RecO (recombination protein O)